MLAKDGLQQIWVACIADFFEGNLILLSVEGRPERISRGGIQA
jgi:hypothetical protein